MLEGATEAAFQLGTGILAGKAAAKTVPGRLKPLAGVAGFIGGTIAGDVPAQMAVESGQAIGTFESRPLFLEERVFAKMGKVAGYDALALAYAPHLLPRKDAQTLLVYSSRMFFPFVIKAVGPSSHVSPSALYGPWNRA